MLLLALSKNKYIVFIFIIYSSFRPIMLKPHQNWTYGSRDTVILVMLKTIKYKRN